MDQNKMTINGKEVDFIKELGIESLPVEKQTEMIKKMADILDRRIILRAMNELSEDEVMEVNATFVSGSREEALKVLDEKIPNFEKIVSEEIIKLREEMLK